MSNKTNMFGLNRNVNQIGRNISQAVGPRITDYQNSISRFVYDNNVESEQFGWF